MNQTYIVKKGDTLYGISNQFGVSVMDLANLNNINTSNLQIGQILKIPTISGTNPNNMIMYTVKKGDSLYAIATKYNTTVNEIVSLNNLKSTNLAIGQILRIPEMYNNEEMNLPNFSNYIVKKGDSLYSIARNNNTTIDTLIKDNSLNSNSLKIGQILKIRISNNGIINDYEECFGEDYIPPETTLLTNYIVKKGDSLYSISKNYNISVNTIMTLNNLKSTNLAIGQVLKIPSTSGSDSTQTYIVKKGDSLYAIAKKYNTSVDTIKRKNNLTSNTLSIGQKLVI